MPTHESRLSEPAPRAPREYAKNGIAAGGLTLNAHARIPAIRARTASPTRICKERHRRRGFDLRELWTAEEPGGEGYQAPAVLASVMPWDSSQRSASMAALQPSAAAVTAWR
jgi:hypothetical protein